jgi:hypothetical protein
MAPRSDRDIDAIYARARVIHDRSIALREEMEFRREISRTVRRYGWLELRASFGLRAGDAVDRRPDGEVPEAAPTVVP